jgi:DNA-binding IclR family transcriptional regulator
MIQSVERALDILNAVAQADEWLGVREIARRTGLKVPTVQQLLKTLQKKGYLEFDPDQRKYRIGVAATLLARGADPLVKLGDFIEPFVERIHKQFGETVVALVYHAGAFMSVACRPSIHKLTVMPPTRGQPAEEPQVMASGRLLLAYMPPEIQRRFVKDAATRSLLPAIREAGVAEVSDVKGSGIAALAVPVWSVRQPFQADSGSPCQAGKPNVRTAGVPPATHCGADVPVCPPDSPFIRTDEDVRTTLGRDGRAPLLALACSMPVQRWTAEVRQRVLDALRQAAAKAERSLP